MLLSLSRLWPGFFQPLMSVFAVVLRKIRGRAVPEYRKFSRPLANPLAGTRGSLRRGQRGERSGWPAVGTRYTSAHPHHHHQGKSHHESDFLLQGGRSLERAKNGLSLGGYPIGEVRNLLHVPPTTRRNSRTQAIKNPNGNPLRFLNWWS